MQSSKVSVIIPTHNRPLLLEEAVQSVLTQTHQAHEIIIVDNGSDDKCKREQHRIVRGNDAIRLYQLSTNLGVSFARNFGLEKATGDFILFLDDDDKIHHDMLDSSLSCFAEDIDVVTCCSEFFLTPPITTTHRHVFFLLNESNLRNDRVGRLLRGFWPDQIRGLENSPFSTLYTTGLPIHSSLIRKQSIGDTEFPRDLSHGEDWFFWLCMAFKGCRFKCNPHVHARIRIHGGNTTRNDRAFLMNIVRLHYKIRESGLLNDREKDFMNHAHLFLNHARLKRLESLKHLPHILKSPFLLAQYSTLFIGRYLSFLLNRELGN